jgi:Tfp pilus assembly protein PilE
MFDNLTNNDKIGIGCIALLIIVVSVIVSYYIMTSHTHKIIKSQRHKKQKQASQTKQTQEQSSQQIPQIGSFENENEQENECMDSYMDPVENNEFLDNDNSKKKVTKNNVFMRDIVDSN